MIFLKIKNLDIIKWVKVKENYCLLLELTKKN